MSKNTKKKLLPNLRFPEFKNKGDWKLFQLSELLFETKQRNRDLKYDHKSVLSVSGEHGCVNQIEFLGRSYAGVSVKDYHVVEKGDIVYTKSPLKRNPYGIIKENKGKPGIVSTLYAVYRVTHKAYPTYLDYYFSNDYFLNSYLQPIVRKGAKNDMKVNNFDVLRGNVVAPEIPEQQKIADCLTSLDELITVENQKLEALQQHKKGLMQQLFPAKGEMEPKLRFKEFKDSGEWEEKSLGSIAEIITGNTPSTSEPENYGGEKMFVSPADLNDGRYVLWSKTTLSDEGFSKTRQVKENSILFVCIGSTIGKLGQNKFECATNQQINSVVPYEGYSNDFLYSALEYHSERFASLAGRQAVPIINKTLFSSVLILVPSWAEQEKIAECFTSLDNLIAEQTQKIESLKANKKGLMQQLFPDVNATE